MKSLRSSARLHRDPENHLYQASSHRHLCNYFLDIDTLYLPRLLLGVYVRILRLLHIQEGLHQLQEGGVIKFCAHGKWVIGV